MMADNEKYEVLEKYGCLPVNWQPVIPSLYWEAISPEQQINELYRISNRLRTYSNTQTEWIHENHDLIVALTGEFQKFKDGEFDQYYKDVIDKWIADNMPLLMAKAMKVVIPGITSDGYFCIYIPESWSDIIFDCGAVYGRSDYGRLILKFNVSGGKGVIDNTYSYSLNAKPSDFETLVRDLEVTARRGDAAFDTLFTNMSEEVVLNGNI